MPITITPAMKLALASPYQTFARCVYIRRRDGEQFGFTDHDIAIDISGAEPWQRDYDAATGIWGTDADTPGDMTPGTSEAMGMLRSPSITDEDLAQGKWDYAYCEYFIVNYNDLTMGRVLFRAGYLGECSSGLFAWRAELRGLGDVFRTSVGELDSPQCRANLGDSRCQVDLAPFTVTGTLTYVADDGVTFFDDARTEAGPIDPIDITNITNADPGVVTLDLGINPNPFTAYQPITIYGVPNPNFNGDTTVRNPTTNKIELPFDTSSFGPYGGGGEVVPLGATSGYFTGGLFTILDGVNAGLQIEVKNYVPGQWTVQLPFPQLCSIGDSYQMIAGCDKSLTTCRDRFDNIVNMRAEPYLPGIDKIMLVGRHS